MNFRILLLYAISFLSNRLIAIELPKNLQEKLKNNICFTENKGQFHDQNYKSRPDVLYGVMAGNLSAHIKTNGLSYQLYSTKKQAISEHKFSTKRLEAQEPQSIYRVDLTWINSNKEFTHSEDKIVSGYSNYYFENCPNGALKVRSYSGVTLHNLYKGIDLHYYEKNNSLKHDYIIAPHSDYKQIQILVEGATIKLNEDGTLFFVTPMGIIQEGAPIVYQRERELIARWKIDGNLLSFEIEDYNPDLEMIIDPLTRVWATYYGGLLDDNANFCTTDSLGNVYMAGSTNSNNGTSIATTGAYQTTISSTDAYLVKFNTYGTRLWGTYYGSPGTEEGYSCATDLLGNIYMAGKTVGGFPSIVLATPGCHQAAPLSTSSDAFLVKFDNSGIRLWGTYYGSAQDDHGTTCCTDRFGNVFLGGIATASNGTNIATPNGFRPLYNGGQSDGFIACFTGNGLRKWGTFYGGWGQDEILSAAADTIGNVYFSGITTSFNSGTAIATPGCHNFNGGAGGFLAKLNPNGVRQWGTYYNSYLCCDGSAACTVDGSGNVYITGWTMSASFPASPTAIATPGCHQSSSGGGLYDAFLAKFTPNGVRIWGTYYGGTGNDLAFGCVTDRQGNVYISGITESGNNIASPGSYQSNLSSLYAAFLVKFDLNGTRQWGTYYQNMNWSYNLRNSCTVDPSGNVYLAGHTTSTVGIASTNGHQPIKGDTIDYDAFLVKFDDCQLSPVRPLPIVGPSEICDAQPYAYYTPVMPSAGSYTWSTPSSWSGSAHTNSVLLTPGISGIISVTSSNACGVSPSQTLNVKVNPLPSIYVFTNDSILCVGETVTLLATGGISYTCHPSGIGLPLIVTPSVTTNYTLSGIDSNGCVNSASILLSVNECNYLSEQTTKNLSVSIFPNPTNRILNCVLTDRSEVVIINNIGQVLDKLTLPTGTSQIDLENFPEGIYLIRVLQDKNLITMKVIKD